MRSLLHRARRSLRYAANVARFYRVHRKYRAFTMIPANLYVKNLLAVDDARGIEGCVVECGVWRGGMSAGMAEILGPEREYFLFDSFEGLPPAADIDGPAAIEWQKTPSGATYHDNCRAEKHFAETAMTQSGAKRFELIQGWFDQTVPTFVPPSPIAILRLDGDWYDSTMVCLKSLLPHLHPDGVVILDDYYTWDGCAKAVHDYLSAMKLPARITQSHGVCVVRNAAVTPESETSREKRSSHAEARELVDVAS